MVFHPAGAFCYPWRWPVLVAPPPPCPYAGDMREPRADRTYAAPDDLSPSAVLPELLRSARKGRVVKLSERDEPVASVVPLEVARAGLAAPGQVRRGRPGDGPAW